MKQTSENLKEIMSTCGKYVEEVFVETRKWIPQTFYVVEIENGMFWNYEINEMDYIPDWAVGYWKTDQAEDNTYYSYDYRIRNDSWVKVQRKEIVTYEYEEIYS